MVTVDGYNRMAIAVNDVVPGPAIIVYKDQKVIVHVHNLLLSDSVTIHWHGLHMKGTPWMDGVGWVSQCPIGSGQKFTYEFTVCIVLITIFGLFSFLWFNLYFC